MQPISTTVPQPTDYWYSDIDIHLLLQSQFHDDLHICQSITDNSRQISNVIDEVVGIFRENDAILAALIPINIGISLNGVFIGLHWVSLVIKPFRNHHLQALYADSLGVPLSSTLPILSQTLSNYNIPVVFDSREVQQSNDYDCGPWIIFNLYSLARTEQLPIEKSDISIHEQRRILKNLKKTQLSSEQQEILGITDSDINLDTLDMLDSIPLTETVPKVKHSHHKDCKITTTHCCKDLFDLEHQHRIIQARDAYIKTIGKSKHDSSISLEDETLNMIGHIHKDDETTEHESDKVEIIVNVKEKDLNKLLEMYEIIGMCENGDLDLRQTFIKIGDLAGGYTGISFNDKNEEFIRNKYGYIQRSNEGKINRNGIYFEKLYQIKFLLEPDRNTTAILERINFSEEFKNRASSLKNDLINIKKMIGRILANEKEFLTSNRERFVDSSDHFEEEYKMENIIQFVSIHYSRVIISRIKYEVSQYETIDFAFREDRYYIARVLTIVGELAREFLENNKSISSLDIKNAFQSLKHLRNLLIHCHDKIVGDINSEREIQHLNETVSIVMNGLNDLIDDDHLRVDIDCKHLNSGIILLKNMIKKSETDSRISSVIKTTDEHLESPNYSIINDLNDLIKKACHTIKENLRNMQKTLKKLNDKYQVKLKLIGTTRLESKFPDSLSLIHKVEIINYGKLYLESNNDDRNTDKLAGHIEACKEKTRQSPDKVINNKNVQYQKSKTNVIKFIMQASRLLSDNSATTIQSLSDLNRKYQHDLDILSNDEPNHYPKSLDMQNKDAILNYSQNINKSRKSEEKVKLSPDKSDKLDKKIEELVVETDYLIMCENNNKMSRTKQQYVVEHVIEMIGQIMRDISSMESQTKPLITSRIHDSASKSAKQARNKGLSHDILSFSNEWLKKEIQDNIMPATQHFKAILTLSKKDDCKLTTATLFSIALSFMSLGLLDSAAKYFQRTISYIRENPYEMKGKNNEAFVVFTSLFRVSITRTFPKLFGTDFCSFISRLYLMQTYIMSCKYEDAYRELVILKKPIQIENVMKSDDRTMKDAVNDVYNSLAHCVTIRGDNKEVIKLMNEIIPISGNQFFKVYLASALLYENQPVEAYQLLHSLLPFKFGPISNYKALFAFVRVFSYLPNKADSIKEATKYIGEMEKLFQDNYGLFKETYHDEFLFMQSLTIRTKIQLVFDKANLPDNTAKEFDSLLVDLEDCLDKFNVILSQIKHDLRNDVRIPSMYFWVCRSYSSLITDKISDMEKEKRKIENAQYYFDKARGKLDYFRSTGRISVSSIKELIKTADILSYGYNKMAARVDQDEESRQVFLNKAAPYMVMVRRYLDRYHGVKPANETKLETSKGSDGITGIKESERVIENNLIAQFLKSKIRPNAKDVNIKIDMKGLDKEHFKRYCSDRLKVDEDDMEFENNFCWLSLGKESLNILQNHVSKKT